jgi:hypothetical protein
LKIGLIIAMALISMPALANESTFSFTMSHEYVDGEKNGVTHKLTRGVLTITGELWLTECSVGALGPNRVTIRVMKEGIVDSTICELDVIPSKPVGRKVSFSTTCVTVPASDFYVVAFRVDDGCDVAATGVLKT